MKKIFSLVLLMLLIVLNISYAQENPVKKIDRMRPALLVIDIQNAYLPKMDQGEVPAAMEMINYFITLFRDNGYPVIRIYNSNEKVGPKPDTEPFEFPKTVLIKPEDPRVIKYYGDAFNKTDLDKILKEKKINTVFLCGLSAIGCVLATYIGADNYDYHAFLIKDALISHKSSYTKNIEEIFSAINYDAVKVMLDNAEK